MTFKKWLTLHHLLILLCLLLIPLLIYKGIGISQKISAVNKAEVFYGEKNWIDAETWYQEAKKNRTIQYKEELIASRLEELAPITAMKDSLSNIALEATEAAHKKDFEHLMTAYTELKQVRSTYLKAEGVYSEYYKQLSKQYGISHSFTDYFQQFRTDLLKQSQQNLTHHNYENESFKWKLLRIPAHFFGTEQEWLDEVNSVFKQYDQTKLEKLATRGDIENMLRQTSSMLKEYKEHSHEAPWVTAKMDALMEAQLNQDWSREDYAAFAQHARQFDTFASSANPHSKVLTYAKQGIDKLLRSAKKSVGSKDYQTAIDLYTALGNYQDTRADIHAVELAWTAAEPVRLLPALNNGEGYKHVAGGGKRFGSSIYVAATDANNQLFFGRMNNEESVQILSNRDLTANELIRSLSIDPNLSTSDTPVVTIEAESKTRTTLYTAFEVLEDRISLLYWIEADNLSIQADGTLQVVNPIGEGEGQTAIFERYGDTYQFIGIKQEFKDITADDVSLYPDMLVRFTCTVISTRTGEALAQGEQGHMILQGDLTFYEGKTVVIGRFTHYTELMTEAQPAEEGTEPKASSPDEPAAGQPATQTIRVPVVKVESMKQ